MKGMKTMETKHTPGSWRVENLSVTTLDGKHQMNYGIRTGKGINGFRVALLGQNQEANAHLIAAAPELLQACKRFLTEDDSEIPHNEIDCKKEPCRYCFAEHTIAKAEAKQ